MFSLKTLLARLGTKRRSLRDMSESDFDAAHAVGRPLAPLRRPPVLPSRPAPKVSRKVGSFGGQP
jgi:hypothetical protein